MQQHGAAALRSLHDGIYGEKDGSIPVDLSIQRLKKLIANGHKYEYVIYSSLGHNNMSETFLTVTDWIKRLTL